MLVGQPPPLVAHLLITIQTAQFCHFRNLPIPSSKRTWQWKFMKMVVVGLIAFWDVHYINLPTCHSPNPHSKGQTGHPRPPFQCHAILLRNGIRSKPINPIKTPVSVKCLTETKEKFTSHRSKWAFHMLFTFCFINKVTHTHTFHTRFWVGNIPNTILSDLWVPYRQPKQVLGLEPFRQKRRLQFEPTKRGGKGLWKWRNFLKLNITHQKYIDSWGCS